MVLLSLAALVPSPARADESPFEFFAEEAEVVTASRRLEPVWRAPAAVDVVTADDIKAYGFKNLWDALRYRAGVDVIDGRSLDGNRALVSVRGFDAEFVQEMQVLVDGRSVFSPLLGGVYWEDIPVQMQDIERIEIVRGPNAALYGSNAGFGVINIITKKPGTSMRGQASSWGASDAYDVAAAGEAGSPGGGLRLSFENRAEEGSPAAGGGPADDFLHLNKLNARGRWNPDARTELELLAGASWMTAGIPGFSNDAEAKHVLNFESAKATRRLGGGSTLEATLSRTEIETSARPIVPSDLDVRTYQYDAGLLQSFAWLDGRVKSNWGAEERYSGADSNQAFAGNPSFNGSPYQRNRLVRGFTHHSIQFADPLTLVAGASLEHSDSGGTQPAWQSALLLVPSEENAFRISYSLAPSLPTLLVQHAGYKLASTPLPTFYVGNSNYVPEKISSWEAGWNGRFLGGALKPTLTLYYMDIRDYGYLVARTSGPNLLLETDNIDRARARGIEVSLDVSLGRGWTAFANYTYENITHWHGPTVLGYDIGRSTPLNKFNVGTRASLPKGFSASAVLGYKDSYVPNSDSRGKIAPIPRHFRLDARVGWTVRPGWDIFVAGQELLQPYFTEYVDGLASPRVIRGGVEVRFGG